MKVEEAPKVLFDDVTTPEAACQALCTLGEEYPQLWVLTSDVMNSTKIKPFEAIYPARTVNVGIAEQTLIGMAAGMATCGRIPVVTAFAAMLTLRACEQIRTDVAYTNLNVKLLGVNGGVALGASGASHHAIEDLAVLRAMGNMRIVVPCDARETMEAVRAAVTTEGPVFVRLGRSKERTIYPGDLDFRIGRAVTVREGTEVTLIGCGRMVAEGLLAADLLGQRGMSVRVLDMHTIKPIDAEAIRKAAAETHMVFTVEEHNMIGGLGGAVAEVMAELDTPTPLRRIGIPDIFTGVGSQDALLGKYGLTGPKLAERVLSELERRESVGYLP